MLISCCNRANNTAAADVEIGNPPRKYLGLLCDHTFCRTCVTKYLTVAINDRRLKDIPCPHTKGCSGQFPPEVIQRLVSADVWRKYDRFQKMSTDDSHYRDCPNSACGKLIRCEASESQPNVTCPDCDTTFCYTHSSAHPGRSYVHT